MSLSRPDVPWPPKYQGTLQDIFEWGSAGQAQAIGSRAECGEEIMEDGLFLPSIPGLTRKAVDKNRNCAEEIDGDIKDLEVSGCCGCSKKACFIYAVLCLFCAMLAGFLVSVIFGLGERKDGAVDRLATSTSKTSPAKMAPSASDSASDSQKSIQVAVHMPFERILSEVVSEPCLGPIRVPPNAKAIVAFTPSVDMKLVHHVVLFGTSTARSGNRAPGWHKKFPKGVVNSAAGGNMCWNPNAPVLFSWARTGQAEAKPFVLPEGSGFEVGWESTQTQWLYLGVHYQNEQGGSHRDISGVNITFSMQAPKRKVKVHWIHTETISIPPGTPQHTICTSCSVQTPGDILAYRNHAHRLAVDLYSGLMRNGLKVLDFARTTGQDPQIYYLADAPNGIRLQANDAILFHCIYDSRSKTSWTYFGKDERAYEMCNQYLMLEESVQLQCSSVGLVNNKCSAAESIPFSSNPEWPLTGTKIRCPGSFCDVGQVSGVDIDPANGDVYIFHRGRSNNFWSTNIIQDKTILRLSATGELIQSLGAALFMVPHGLTVTKGSDLADKSVLLWLTDTGLHQVLQMDAISDKITVTLGQRAVPGKGANHFNKPTHVAVASDGSLFVADGYGNSRIAIFQRNGPRDYRFVREFGAFGVSAGKFSTPHGITLDKDGRVFVADRNNGRIQVFDQQGKLLQVWDAGIKKLQASNPSQPWRGYVCAISYDRKLDVIFALVGDAVLMYDRNGIELQRFGRAGQRRGEFDFPHAIAAETFSTGDSMVYVAELGTKRVQQFVAHPR